MADKLLKSSNGLAWYEKVVSPSNGSSWYEKVVKVSNGSTWYTNYPRIKEYSQNFKVAWTQGYRGDGVKLDSATWGDDLLTGDTVDFHSMLGFDKTAIQNFVEDGTITSVRILINLKSTSLNGSPDVYFCPHVYSSAPTSLDLNKWNKSYLSSKHFPNKAYGGYWVTLTKDHIINPYSGSFFSGIGMYAFDDTQEDSGKWSGKSSYDSLLQITVLK